MNEVVVTFGAGGHLVGTLTQPAGHGDVGLGVLMLNAGVIHRVGPHRANVKLARRLAALGYPTLRFDLSGQGDSRPAPDPAPFDQQAVADIRAALDHFERLTGIRRFAVVGFCSGAIHGQNAASQDVRIVGLWMLDGYYYPTVQTWLRALWRKLSGRRRGGFFPWLLSRSLRALAAATRKLGDLFSSDLQPAPGGSSTPFPSREAYAASMQALCDRGVDMSLVFSPNMEGKFNYADQLRDAFRGHRFAADVRCVMQPSIDHTLSSLQAQQVVGEMVSSWLAGIKANQPVTVVRTGS